jgi:hypothetical protein
MLKISKELEKSFSLYALSDLAICVFTCDMIQYLKSRG